ncbi:testicular acid phosphatase homolog isoform X2 [Sipha flava]|uniref:acid phosphatase n=1 Tax=Sipha flava TaxID=143950 RepID=A0A8B8FPJ4_9HEMI|nr:testicular acid phosphatase homolog isoform X2 [Sipha flava]
MTQSNQNAISPKNTTASSRNDKVGAFAAVLLSGMVIAAFVGYYLVVGEESRKKNSLQLIIAVFRQGDRSPLKWETYPNDMYPPMSEGTWPDGLGQLTNAGKLKSYEFGRRFRNRYTKFLPFTDKYSFISVHSTDTDRAEMTASAFLAGAFPPAGKQIWNSDLLWIPIPIYSISPDKDDQRNHMTLPSWVKVKNYMSLMEDIVLEWSITYSKTDQMKKFRSGKLIGEIVRTMRDKMDERLDPNKKIFAYFSHEQTLIDFLHTLGMKNLFKPSYGAAAFVELHKIRGEHYVKILYTKSYDTPDLLSLDMESQTSFLPTLEDFIIKTENYIPKNWDKECQLK